MPFLGVTVVKLNGILSFIMVKMSLKINEIYRKI